MTDDLTRKLRADSEVFHPAPSPALCRNVLRAISRVQEDAHFEPSEEPRRITGRVRSFRIAGSSVAAALAVAAAAAFVALRYWPVTPPPPVIVRQTPQALPLKPSFTPPPVYVARLDDPLKSEGRRLVDDARRGVRGALQVLPDIAVRAER